MKIFEASTTIRARPAQVWQVLADVVQWPSWLPTVSSVEGLDGVLLREGARYRLAQPRLPTAVWKATRVQATGGFTWQSTSPGVRVTVEHVLQVQPGGSTRLTLRLSFSGLLGGFAARLAGATSERYLVQEAEALRRTVEQAVLLSPELLAAGK
jgi:uncharacterized membrane protein